MIFTMAMLTPLGRDTENNAKLTLKKTQPKAPLCLRLERDQSCLDFLLRVVRVQLPKHTTANVIDQTVHLQSPFLDRLQNDALLLEGLHTLPHVQFHQLEVGLVRRQRLEKLEILLPDLAQRQQPGVEDTQLLVAQRRGNSSAPSVAAQNDVLDAQMTDGVFDDRRRTKVGRVQNVGNVTVDKDVTGLQAQDGGLRAARVGAANPEDLGTLADRKAGEEVGLLPDGFGSPFLVLFQGGGESV